MKKTAAIFVIFCLILSCEKFDNTCKCDNPLEDIEWLKELKNSFDKCPCEISIIQATFNKQTVFYVALTDPVCDGVFNINLVDCNGTILKNYPTYDQVFDTEVTDRKVLYRCKT